MSGWTSSRISVLRWPVSFPDGSIAAVPKRAGTRTGVVLTLGSNRSSATRVASTFMAMSYENVEVRSLKKASEISGKWSAGSVKSEAEKAGNAVLWFRGGDCAIWKDGVIIIDDESLMEWTAGARSSKRLSMDSGLPCWLISLGLVTALEEDGAAVSAASNACRRFRSRMTWLATGQRLGAG